MRDLRIGKLLVAGLFVLALSTACGGFYTDDPTATPGPSPTPLPEGYVPPEDVEDLLIANTRLAISQRLGEEVAAVGVDRISGVAWTTARPGCFPPPADYEGSYVIPGLVVSVYYKNIRYEYHADAFAGNGALCDSVAQLLPFNELDELGRIITPETFVEELVVARNAAEAAALVERFPGAISIISDEIDWAGEVLLGTTIAGSGCEFSAEAERVEVNFETNVVTLGIAGRASGACEQEHLVPVFVLIEETPADAGFVTDVSITGGEPPPLPTSPVGPTPTPDPLFEAIQTAVAR